MGSKQISFLGVQAAIFANAKRAGFELSLPFGGLRSSQPDRIGVLIDEPKVAPASTLAERVAAIKWYHTLDLGQGVVTPGFFDHRPYLSQYRLPERLDGMRVLDVACFDGFWAFEFERRGAAEVVALDIDRVREMDLPYRTRERMTDAELDSPFGNGFELAREALGSKVKRVFCNIYDITPEKLSQFDLVHVGDVLLHLRDPLRGLRQIRSVVKGKLLLSDCFFPDLDRHELPLVQYESARIDNIWWRFGAIALKQMVADAGFERVEELTRFRYGTRGAPANMWHISIEASG